MRKLKSMTTIAKRFIAAVPAVALQALWMYILFVFFSRYAVQINLLLTLSSFVVVLYLNTKREEGAYKSMWLIAILTLPVLGIVLYLNFGNKRTGKPLRKALARAQLPAMPNDPAVWETVKHPRLAQTFSIIQKKTGFSPVFNTGVQYYPLGDDMFPHMLEALEQAEHFIYAEYFIIESGEMLDKMVEIMKRKAANGVDVRLLFDDVGSIATFSKKEVRALREGGIKVTVFNPLIVLKGTLNYRDHRKMLIVDGKTAFSGGINLADEYINTYEKHGHWKDIGFQLTGAPVAGYIRMFCEFWNAFSPDKIPKDIASALPPLESDTKDGIVLSYYDSPLYDSPVSNNLYIDLLSQATDYVWFYTPYLMLGDALLDCMIKAAERGVDVRLILPGIPDKKLVYRLSHSYYRILLQAGVKISEYTPGFLHAKACIVDDTVCCIGTVNLDYRSLFLHFENNSIFYQSSVLHTLKHDYTDTLKKCRPVALSDTRGGFFRLILDGILRLFAPLC